MLDTKPRLKEYINLFEKKVYNAGKSKTDLNKKKSVF